jgi:hypothetical protein
MSSSIKFEFAGADVGCIINTSFPRTDSAILTFISPSEKRFISAFARGISR